MNCQYCDKLLKNQNALIQHEIRCHFNNDRISCKGNPTKGHKGGNQYTKAKELGINYEIKDTTRELISDANKKRVWTKESRERLSSSMKDAVIKYPNSYNANNVCGRVKNIEICNNGIIVKVKGNWEYIVANYFNENDISWTNEVEPSTYFWNNAYHLYFPDFYLYDYNLYVEVKGYQRDRDVAKWNDFTKKLLILKKNDIDKIKNNNFNMVPMV